MTEKYAIIVAGGKGLRMGAEIPKQFLLLNNTPVLMHTLSAFYRADSSISLILVLPEEHQAYWKKLCREHDFSIPHILVPGGETRFHSVQNALLSIPDNVTVAVHDGVRPLVSKKLILNLFELAKTYKAVYPAIPVVDTLRKYYSAEQTRNVDRMRFRRVQTPQVFHSNLLKRAYRVPYSERFTDDISVVELLKVCRAKMIDGEIANIKITTPTDLIIARALLNGS